MIQTELKSPLKNQVLQKIPPFLIHKPRRKNTKVEIKISNQCSFFNFFPLLILFLRSDKLIAHLNTFLSCILLNSAFIRSLHTQTHKRKQKNNKRAFKQAHLEIIFFKQWNIGLKSYKKKRKK